jgi:hypothetical protein
MRSIKLQFSLEKPEAPKTTGRKTLKQIIRDPKHETYKKAIQTFVPEREKERERETYYM